MFDAATPATARPLMQDPSFAAALRMCGEDPVTLPSGLVLLRRRIAGVSVLMLPRATPPADLCAQLAQAGLHRHPLILSPQAPCALPPALRLRAPVPLWQVDLRTPEATRRAMLHQNWRHQLGQALHHDLRVVQRPLPAGHLLLSQDAAQARDRGYRGWPPRLTAAFARLAPRQTHLFTARLRGFEVAHMLFLSHGDGATYHIGYTSTEGRAVHAHNLLLWEAMRSLAARGITTLDLGPPTTPTIDRFKRRAGAMPAPTGGTWLRWTPLARGQHP